MGTLFSKLRPFEAMYRLLLRAAKTRKIDVEFSYEYFLLFTETKECHYCNATIIWDKRIKKARGYNLDRKDPDIGYTRGNCVVCCKRCNIAKGSQFSYDEWYTMTECFRNKSL